MKEYKLTVEFRTGQRFCYYGKTKKKYGKIKSNNLKRLKI